jgi:hypothetical protein
MPKGLILASGVFLTLAVWSFLWKINPVYRFAEHVFVGFGAAHFAVVVYHGTIKPNLLAPLKEGNLLLIIPGILGLLYLMRLSPKTAWLSRYPMALNMGVAAGVGIRSVLQGTLFPQMLSLFQPMTDINQVITVVGVLSTIFYFFFGFEAKGPAKGVKHVGRIVMMIFFGAIFGNTVMSRLSYLLGRLQFIFGDVLHWIPGT